MSHPTLDPSDISSSLATLNASLSAPWSLAGNALAKTFRFVDFPSAFAFMTRVALAAEKLDHHPDWTNVWNRVEVRLSTHDAGGITLLDFRLAAAIEAAAGTVLAHNGGEM
jgi:4a-hydroxytetrahydrobiopterin dehydratase